MRAFAQSTIEESRSYPAFGNRIVNPRYSAATIWNWYDLSRNRSHRHAFGETSSSHDLPKV
jgi:hypothetical protein